MKTTTKTMTRDMLVRHYVNHEDRHLSFIANVIMTGGCKVAAKLKSLYALEMAGHQISMAQFDIDRLVIDGRVVTMWDLASFKI